MQRRTDQRPIGGRAGMAIAALAFLTIAMSGLRTEAQAPPTPGGPAFQVPRAEKEFSALIPDLRGYCDNVTKGDAKAFFIALTVYGPLDLEVRKAQSPTQLRYLRDFHVGVAAAMSQMPQDLASRLGQPFIHSPADVAGRKRRLVKELPQIEAFVKRLQAVPQITLLAHWGFQDSYRVNDTFHMMGQTNEAVPSPLMGFVPSGEWKHYKTVQEYLDTIHVTESTFDGLQESLLSLLVVAARRTAGGGTEVIGLGIANNTSGLLLTPGAKPPPAAGDRTQEGATYSVVDQVKPGVFYFETT